MSRALNLAVVPFSCHRVESRKKIFEVHKFPTIAAKLCCVTVKCSLTTPMGLMGKIEEKLKERVDNSLAAVDTDIPANLCIIDTLQRLGIDRYFQSQIDTIMEETYRLDSLKSGRDVVGAANFLTSAIIGDPEYSDVRVAFAKQVVLGTRMDDFFDHVGPREESYKILELVKEWEEKAGAEYGSEEVEILFTALYKTVNELAEMAHVQQGRSVKHLLIQLWVELLSVFKLELETWNNINEAEAVSLDEYLCSSWVSAACRVCILTSMQFLRIKFSEEMLESEECTDLCWHASMVDRLLNDIGSFKRERNQNTVNSVSILVGKDGRGISEDEAVAMLKKMAEYNRRKLMQLVYKKRNHFPKKM